MSSKDYEEAKSDPELPSAAVPRKLVPDARVSGATSECPALVQTPNCQLMECMAVSFCDMAWMMQRFWNSPMPRFQLGTKLRVLNACSAVKWFPQSVSLF